MKSSPRYFFLWRRPPPTSTLFPYTTLFRSSPSLPIIPGWSAVNSTPSSSPARIDPIRSSETSSAPAASAPTRSEEHTSELQSHSDLVCRLLLEKKKQIPLQAPATAPTTPSA